MPARNTPFLIGGTDIYDYQDTTGFKRWNTLQAAATAERRVVNAADYETQPAELDVLAVQRDLGLDYIQARNHVKGRMQLRKMQARR